MVLEHTEAPRLRIGLGAYRTSCTARAGVTRDNALMETVIGLFKTECIHTTVFHAGPYRTITDVEWATAGWIDWWNNRRLHSSLAYQAPEEFEQAHYVALNRELQPA